MLSNSGISLLFEEFPCSFWSDRPVDEAWSSSQNFKNQAILHRKEYISITKRYCLRLISFTSWYRQAGLYRPLTFHFFQIPAHSWRSFDVYRRISSRILADLFFHIHINLTLTLILLMWRIRWAPNSASKWQMEFNSAFKGLSYQSGELLHF
jgi:hypothetical protein